MLYATPFAGISLLTPEESMESTNVLLVICASTGHSHVEDMRVYSMISASVVAMELT